MGSGTLRTGVCAAALWGAILAAAPATGPLADDDNPGVRNAHALAYDGRVVVLFGGATESGVVGDTWGWDGKDWPRLAVGGPPARTFPAVAGGWRSRVFLFGGSRVLFGDDTVAENRDATKRLFADTWTWDGARWTEVAGPQPPARSEAAAAWDPKRKRMVLFGGYTWKAGVREYLQDTWEFNGAAWARFSTGGPSPRAGAAMAFDAELGQVVLFGGSPAPKATRGSGTARRGPKSRRRRRRRAASTRRWPARPPATCCASAAGTASCAPPTRGACAAGSGARSRPSDAPPARNHAAMTHDTKRGCFVLFGGHDGVNVFGDVWERCGTADWKRVAKTGPRERVPNSH